MKKAIVPLLALVFASLALVACGGGSDTTAETGPAPAPANAGGGGGGGGGGGAQSLKVTADSSGQLAWSPTELSAKAGQVTLTLDNPAPIQHDITLTGSGVDEKSDLVSQGSASVTANLKPGTYEYFCSVPGHKQAGMDGTLTVK